MGSTAIGGKQLQVREYAQLRRSGRRSMIEVSMPFVGKLAKKSLQVAPRRANEISEDDARVRG